MEVRTLNIHEEAIKRDSVVEITRISYNNNLGKVKVLRVNDTYFVNRTAYNRVWKKVTDKLGGLTKVSFDNNNRVERLSDADYFCMILDLTGKGKLAE